MTKIKNKTRVRIDNIDVRKEQIISAAVKVAAIRGYQSVSRKEIAMMLGISPALINYHFESIDTLRSLLIKSAIETDNLPVIAQGISSGDPRFSSVKEKIRRAAINSLFKR